MPSPVDKTAKSFVASVYDYVFGPGRVELHPLSNQQEAAAYIRTQKGLITVPEIIALTAEMIERIKDANLMTTEDKFPVVDVSVSGLKLIVNNANLTNTLPKQKGFGVDIFFKMQAPFHFFVRVAWTKKNDDGELVLGLEFTGKSRVLSEKSRFEQNLEVVKQLSSAGA